jgi:hypothetical protein
MRKISEAHLRFKSFIGQLVDDELEILSSDPEEQYRERIKTDECLKQLRMNGMVLNGSDGVRFT